MSLLGDKISVLYQYVMGYLPTAAVPLKTESDRLEKEDESLEEESSEKMSDRDLITFGGEEARPSGEDVPDTETVTAEEANPESSDSLEPEQKVEEEEFNVVSTASIDLNIVEPPKPKEQGEEVSVEFEQLNLSPVGPKKNEIPIEATRMEAKEKKNAKRPANNHAAESKIAMEIREMRKREEELKQMRDKVTSRIKSQEISNESVQSDGSTKSEDFLEDDQGSSNVNYHTKNSMTRAVSLDSLHVGQTYNIGYAFCHRRKDRIKVKPLEDGEDGEERENSKYCSLKESPIEREIRQAREREEELKKEKGLVVNGKEKVKIIKSEEPVKVSDVAVSGNDTQRLLATTRIQQEIQEQTRREMALRESGHIQTISQERTDSKVTRIREAGNSVVDSPDRKQSPSPTVEIYEKTNGHAVNGKSPSSPTSSSSSANNVPVGRRLSNPPAPGRGISMQRFIKSKGKDLGFNAFSGGNYYNENSNLDYYEIRPPQVRKINGHLGPVISRRSATAESKIQEELKEMKAREDELKRQRARLLGLSQPNLSSLISDEDLVTNGDSEEVHLDRSNSNPNLLDENDNHDSTLANGRRRSALIAQWEQRIQKAEATKS